MWSVGCECVRGASGLPGSGFESGIIVQVSGGGYPGVGCKSGTHTISRVSGSGVDSVGCTTGHAPTWNRSCVSIIAPTWSSAYGLMVQEFRVLRVQDCRASGFRVLGFSGFEGFSGVECRV